MFSEYNQQAELCHCCILCWMLSKIKKKNFEYGTQLPRSTVYHIMQQIMESGESLGPARKSHTSRLDTKCDAAFLEQLQMWIDPSIVMQELAQQLNVIEATICRAVHEDLWYKLYSLKIHQLLT